MLKHYSHLPGPIHAPSLVVSRSEWWLLANPHLSPGTCIVFGLPAPDICSQATQFYFLICEMHQMLVFVSFSRFIAPPSHQNESQNLGQRVWKTIFFKRNGSVGLCFCISGWSSCVGWRTRSRKVRSCFSTTQQPSTLGHFHTLISSLFRQNPCTVHVQRTVGCKLVYNW